MTTWTRESLINSDKEKLDVNLVAADDVGRNALHYAAMNGNLPIMKMLFKTGQVSISQPSNPPDSSTVPGQCAG